MAITIKIKGDDQTNFETLSKIAEEFFGKSKPIENNQNIMLVDFQNNSYAQQYIKVIDCYFPEPTGKFSS
jgi:hypothetical protein